MSTLLSFYHTNFTCAGVFHFRQSYFSIKGFDVCDGILAKGGSYCVDEFFVAACDLSLEVLNRTVDTLLILALNNYCYQLCNNNFNM